MQAQSMSAPAASPQPPLVAHPELLNDPAFAALEPALLALLADAEVPLLGQMAEAHMRAGGKRLRARLALAAGKAFGLPFAATQNWALACELMHNATLVHDDLQDGDEVRRGQPTVWRLHGAAQAINVGDWLFMRAFQTLLQPPVPACAAELARALASGLATVIAGQTSECAWIGADIPDAPAYEQMIAQKTAALFCLPVTGAAILAGHGADAAQQFSAAFAPLGALFQIVDDTIDLWGDKGRQTPGQDLYEGKMSALVVAHVQHAPKDAGWLKALLHTPRAQTQAAEVQRAMDAFVASGARAAVVQRAEHLAAQARADVAAVLAPLMQNLLEQVMAPLAKMALTDAGAARG